MKPIIIEKISECNEFIERCKSYDWIVVPFYCNGDKPVYIDSLSVLYIYVVNLDEDVILVFNHTEGLNMDIEVLNSFPETNKIFVHQKKKFKNFLDRDNLFDMDMVEYFNHNSPLEEDIDTSAHIFFTKFFSKFADLNTIIPITKHFEKGQLIVQSFLGSYDCIIDDALMSYNNVILESLYQVEKNGLRVDSDLYKHKHPKGIVYKDNMVYTEYNLYTTTGRPSNRYGGVNYAALKKDDGSRMPFISRFDNGYLVSFDYDAYHLRLLADLVDYQFPEDISVHTYLGQFYFDKQVLDEDEYQASKGISFKQLYGGISNDYLAIPFFQKVSDYTKALWEQYKETGFVITPIFGRKLHDSYFTDMNSAKLLNYLLQAFETERNMAVIHNLLPRISSFSSKLILYTYDSFLIDFDPKDGGEFIKIVKRELEQNGKFPVKIEVGPNYHEMKLVKIKA